MKQALKDPVIIGGRSQGNQAAVRATREICEIVLREQESKGRRYSAGVVDRAVAAGAPLFFGDAHKLADAIADAFGKSEIAA